MTATLGTFERKETKYLISDADFEQLMSIVGDRLQPDAFARSTVTSIYYDTDCFGLINRSMEKPTYKEKLRLRTYGAFDPLGPVFVELKKKFKGIVYKRRVQMSHEGALSVMAGMPYEQASALFPLDPARDTMHHSADVDRQIGREIDACVARHPGLKAAMAIIVDRLAFRSIADPELRITFDVHPRYRTGNLSFAVGTEGRLLLDDDVRIMEIKCSGAYPLWLVRALNHVHAYPQSCSKYGMAYQMAKPGVFFGEHTGHAQPIAASEEHGDQPAFDSLHGTPSALRHGHPGRSKPRERTLQTYMRGFAVGVR